MSSNINPNNIDGTYPIAGQDNNSQGFRDNFTNTKVNFQYAEQEITDLQDQVILKGALPGVDGTPNNNMNDTLLYAALIRDFSASKVTIGSVGGAVSVNYANGHYQSLSTTASITLSFTNFPTLTVILPEFAGVKQVGSTLELLPRFLSGTSSRAET